MTPETQAAIRADFHNALPAILEGRDPETDWNDPGLGSPVIRELLELGLIGEAVLTAICGVTGLSKTELRSRRRARCVARPRQVACFLMQELSRLSLPQIGRFLGGRDHTTVTHANRVVREKLAAGDELTTRIYRDAKRRLAR